MITKEQCMLLNYGADIHYTGKHPCTRTIGPKGGVKENITHVRKSGKCQTWKRSPERFCMPVKHGLYESGYIDNHNCSDFHLGADCPLLHDTEIELG